MLFLDCSKMYLWIWNLIGTLPLHTKAGSWGTVENGRQSNLRGRKQQSCIRQGCLRHKVIRTLPQRLWILHSRESGLRGEHEHKDNVVGQEKPPGRKTYRSCAGVHPPWGRWAGLPWVCRGCGPPDESWAAGWAAAHTPGSALQPSPVPQGSLARGSPQTGCWTRWTHPLCRTSKHMSAWKRQYMLYCKRATLSHVKLSHVFMTRISSTIQPKCAKPSFYWSDLTGPLASNFPIIINYIVTQ